MRDRDVRNAVAVALSATNEFDDASAAITSSIITEGAITSRTAQVAPFDSHLVESWDSGGLDGCEVDSRCKITLYIRDGDPQARDEAGERLVSLVCNVINNNSLSGLVMPAFSRATKWTWLDSMLPDRSIELIYSYRYLLSSAQGFDTTE